MNNNDNNINEINQNSNENKKKGNLSCILMLLLFTGVILFFSWLIETNTGLAYILLLFIVVILIIIGIVADIQARKNIKKMYQDEMKLICDLDSDAKEYQIRFDNLCMNNRNEFNSAPLGDHHYYKRKIIKEFVEQTNDDTLNLIYSPNENIWFNSEYSNFENAFDKTSINKLLINYNCITREYFNGKIFNTPLKIAMLDCYRPKCEPYSITLCIIDKKIDADIKMKQINFTLTNDNCNNIFDIETSDELKARNFLADGCLEFITEFRKKYKIDFEIIFKDKIYIRFFTKNMFKEKDMLLNEEGDKVSAIQYYVITKFIKELAKFL